MENLVEPAVKYVEKGLKAITKQCGYMCCLKQFQKDLVEQESALGAVQQDFEQVLKQELKNTRIAKKTVEKWSIDTEQAMNDVVHLQNAMKQDQHCFNNACPNWFSRYRRGREADGLITTLKNLKAERDKLPQVLTHEANLPIIGFIQPDGFMPSTASASALGQIMSGLENDGVNVIGLHGMPGAGKTTLAKQVQKEATEKKLFDEYLIVTVSEEPDISHLQKRLAEQLGVVLDETSSSQHKASRLMLRLQDDMKKLLVLDDVWGECNLSEIGIPPVRDLKNCKVLLTTRRVPACRAMGCQHTILLDILTEDEAWCLFKDAANLNDALLTDVAKMVATACGGLPLAIMSVGKALRGETETDAWRVAYDKLRKGENEDIRDISGEQNAYRCLKVSFDKLPNEETKKCLMMCALFPEDYAFIIPQLASYAMQLGFCQHSSPTHAQQLDLLQQISEGVRELKNSHLLQELEIQTGAFTMHDLVRDVILRIGRRYSVVGEPGTTEFKKESLELQTNVEAHFRNNGFTNFPNESLTANVPITEFIQSEELILYQSAESALVRIVEALQTDDVNVIGLHGMPGVGKTSWAKHIKDQALRLKLFDECVFVHVSCYPVIGTIQDQVAAQLQLGFDAGSTVQQRASKLMQRLLDGKKKLLVLDDVWRKITLNSIGIPSSVGLKILLTTPRISVCVAMNCQRKILLDPLAIDEERSIIESIRNSPLTDSYKFKAYKMIEQVKHLPIALKVRGLIECEDNSKSTLLQSIESELGVIHISQGNIHIQLSDEGHRCLLLCSFLATKDNVICLEELARYTYALGMYRPAQSVKDTMALLLKAIDELKDYNFLFPIVSARQQPQTVFPGGGMHGTTPSRVDVQYIKLHATARDIALSHFYE
ncbi:Disease resistance protein At4g27190 [Euphorbia peplus]|nr:Disease resistance protein At4g27190 [Euphorbia peplus]